MLRSAWDRHLGLVTLSLVLGMTMVALHRMILATNLFGFDMLNAALNHAALIAFVGVWPYELLLYALCVYGTLYAYRMVVATPGDDLPWYRIATITGLILGGLMGALFTTMSGWYIGLQAFIAFGMFGAITAVGMILVAKIIIRAGQAIDPWLKRIFTREGSTHG